MDHYNACLWLEWSPEYIKVTCLLKCCSFSRMDKWFIYSPTCPARLWGPSSFQCVPKALSPGIKWPVHETDHARHLLPRLRMSGSMPPIPCITSYSAPGQRYLLNYQLAGKVWGTCYTIWIWIWIWTQIKGFFLAFWAPYVLDESWASSWSRLLWNGSVAYGF